MEFQDYHDSSYTSDFIAIIRSGPPSASPSPQSEREARTETTPRQHSTDLKRSAVPVACLRCRRRKVRCSGLPGPCMTCAKFGVSCIDPGKRRARSKSTSGFEPWSFISSQQSGEILQPKPRYGQLKVRTDGLWDDLSYAFNDDFDSLPVSPGCHSDMGPEVDAVWSQSASDVCADYFVGLARAQTYPNQGSILYNEQLHSPIPAIRITSDEGSVDGTPLLHPKLDALTTYIPNHELPPLQIPLSTSMDYYSDFLSPTDQPPVVARRASLSFGNNTSRVEDWTQKTPAPSKRRHTTCSLSNPGLAENAELIWMLKSPRTANYVKQYTDTVHPQYPFLDISISEDQSDAPNSLHVFENSFSSMKAYQRLMTAAIGAMQQRNSRDISARYVRHAMTMQKNEDLDLFGSISGIHCAMLLAIYLLLELQMEFGPEEEDTSHPHVNLWLWDCRIAAACIDLGLNEWPQGEEATSTTQQEQQERAMAVLCLNTFQSVWFLDRNISIYSRRPRALHAEDIDVEMLTWIMDKERAGSMPFEEHTALQGYNSMVK